MKALRQILSMVLSLLLCVTAFWGCQKKSPANKSPNDTQDTELTVSYTAPLTCKLIENSSLKTLDQCHSEMILSYWTDGEWESQPIASINELPFGFEFYTETATIRYDTEFGHFIDIRNFRTITLSRTQRNRINNILTNMFYIVNPPKDPLENMIEISKIKINEDFLNREIDISQYTCRQESLSDISAFRVIEIQQDRVFLSSFTTYQANYLLLGVPDSELAVGDHVSLKTTVYYDDIPNTSCHIILLSDVTEFKVLNDEEIYAIYEEYSNTVCDKPVIYLYPEQDTLCSVRVDINGRLTCTYPEHGENGWKNFVATPDGTLYFPDGGEYYCLYWEGISHFTPDFSTGFCIKGSETADFLREILPQLGLTPREANEFIIYWLPRMQENEYNLISFQQDAYTASAPLEITPTPDSLLRVFMVYCAIEESIEITPQTFDSFERIGFTVVEWGGGEVK